MRRNLPPTPIAVAHTTTTTSSSTTANDTLAADENTRQAAQREFLCKHGFDIKADITASFIKAAVEGNLAVVEGLLNLGIHPDATLDEKLVNTALIQAAFNFEFDIVRLLAEHGANVNAVLMYTANLAKEIRPQFYDVFTQITALHHAAIKGDTETIAMLLEHGAIIDAQTIGGITPLAFAHSIAEPDLRRGAVALLLKHGASITNANLHTVMPDPFTDRACEARALQQISAMRLSNPNHSCPNPTEDAEIDRLLEFPVEPSPLLKMSLFAVKNFAQQRLLTPNKLSEDLKENLAKLKQCSRIPQEAASSADSDASHEVSATTSTAPSPH